MSGASVSPGSPVTVPAHIAEDCSSECASAEEVVY